MSKVKKGPAVTGARRAKGKPVRKSPSKGKQAPSKRAAERGVKAKVADFQVRELDPQVKCGPNTSVQFLHRVIERFEGRVTNHLVFFDQHGWYCEHGRACPAVAQAKKYIGWTARDSD